MQREDQPVMTTGLGTNSSESSERAEAPIHVFGPSHNEGAGVGKSLSYTQ